MELQRKPDEKLNLFLQLHDGIETMPKKVFVTILDETGAVVTPKFEIPHVAGGLFIESTQKMPTDKEKLIAVYSVTDSDGTTPSCEHSITVERYKKLEEIELPEFVRPKPFAIRVRVRSTPRIKVRVRND